MPKYDLSGSKILVTGGAGFIGSRIVRQLLDEGCREIVVIDNMVRGRVENLAGVKPRRGAAGSWRHPQSRAGCGTC